MHRRARWLCASSILSKRFDTIQAVNGVSFDVPLGAYFCLLGPSGCGKTTILRSIAGFHVPDAGRIEIGDRDMTFVSPNKRELGMVYQNYALFPHLTVYDNIAFGLKMRGYGGHEVATACNACWTLFISRTSAIAGRRNYPEASNNVWRSHALS